MAVILIVEDDMFIRELVEMIAEELGHQTLTASDVDEALLLLRSAQHIDAVLTDVRLKSVALGGYELANEAIKLWPKLRVLYMSGNPRTDEMTALFVDDAHFLQKPFTLPQLEDAVNELLRVLV